MLYFFLLFLTIQGALSCSSDSGGGSSGGGHTHDDNGVLDHKTNGLREFADVPDKADDLVAEDESDLRCSSDNTGSGCCWRDAGGDRPFKALSGSADADTMEAHFDDFEKKPSGPGVIAAYAEDKQSKGDYAALESCVICLQDPDAGPMTVDVKHWGTPGTTLEACVTPADSFDPQNCQSVELGESSVDVEPLPEPFRLVLRGGSFLDDSGSIVMMDDLEVSSRSSFTNCQEEETTTSRYETTTGQTGPQCGALDCNFDQGTPCAYQTAGSGGSQGWVVTDRPIGNANTGVRRSAPQSPPYYAGAVVPKGGKAVMKSGLIGSNEPSVARFSAYEATTEINLRACIDGETNCCWESNPRVSRADLQWQTVDCPLPPGAQELWFVAENKGNQHGSAGIDDIMHLDQTGNPVCNRPPG